MKKLILGILVGLGLFFSFNSNTSTVYACWGPWETPCTPSPTASPTNTCTWIKLNTNVPFIGNCISTTGSKWWYDSTTWKTTVTQETAFPYLVSALTKFIIWIIVLTAFGFIVVWGLRMTMEWASPGQYKAWRDMIIKAAIAIALIWMSWIILNAINPNFFKN